LPVAALWRKKETGVVIARHAQVRSSTAVVAADLVEVNRGDAVDILDSTDVQDPSAGENKERWYRVRARDESNTEGWIEARNVMSEDVFDRSRKLSDEDKTTQTQANGQLRASTNLRLMPDRSGNDNIVLKLDSGAKFDIVGWKRVPKPKASETTEVMMRRRPEARSRILAKGNPTCRRSRRSRMNCGTKCALIRLFRPRQPDGYTANKLN
jgi:hypothetical protein